jgi:hypothetical protein
MKLLKWEGLLLILASAILVRAGELDTKMDKMAAQFKKDASVRSADLLAAPLAVFPFDCEPKLMQKRVNLAVSELLTKSLVQSGNFKLIERTQLDKILKEQALGQTGAIDTPTAAKVGQLIGAKLAVLGSISKVGKYYQISSRLVEIETSEIISVSIVEVPVEVFDQEAARYLVLVPETQTLGIYFSFNYMPGSMTKLDPGSHFGVTFTPAQDTSSWASESMGLGLRYWPFKRIMLDGCFFFSTGYMGSPFPIFTVSDPHFDTKSISENLSGSIIKFSANWVQPVSKVLNIYAGLGVWVSLLSFNHGQKVDNVRIQSTSTNAVEIRFPAETMKVVAPMLRLGLELKPQQRFGISLFANFYLPRKFNYDISILKFYNTGGSNWTFSPEEKMTIRSLDYLFIDLELTLAFYF